MKINTIVPLTTRETLILDLVTAFSADTQEKQLEMLAYFMGRYGKVNANDVVQLGTNIQKYVAEGVDEYERERG